MAEGKKMKYSDKLKDPRWQKKRLEIFTRDNWTCRGCRNTERTLHIHHKVYYPGLDPWNYSNNELITYCELCHNSEHGIIPIKDNTDFQNNSTKFDTKNRIPSLDEIRKQFKIKGKKK